MSVSPSVPLIASLRARSSQPGMAWLPATVVGNGAFAVGLHVGVELVRVAVCNLHAQVLGCRALPRQRGEPPEHTIQDIARLVDQVAGMIRSAPSLGWGEVSVTAPLAAQLGLHVR